MARQTVAGQIWERLRAWGVEQVFGYPGDGINGLVAALGGGRKRAASSSRPGTRRWPRSKRSGTRSSPGARRVHGHVGARGDPPAQRALRRQARPRAGGGDRRADRRVARWAAPTSRRSTCQPVQGRGQRVRADGDGARAAAERCSTGRSAPPSPAAHRPRSSSRPTCRSSTYAPPAHAFKMVPSSLGIALADAVPPDDAAVARAAEVLNAGERVAMLVGQGARGARRRGRAGGRPARRRRGQGAAGQGRAVRRPALRHRVDRAARHPAELRADDGTATRC